MGWRHVVTERRRWCWLVSLAQVRRSGVHGSWARWWCRLVPRVRGGGYAGGGVTRRRRGRVVGRALIGAIVMMARAMVRWVLFGVLLGRGCCACDWEWSCDFWNVKCEKAALGATDNETKRLTGFLTVPPLVRGSILCFILILNYINNKVWLTLFF